MTPFFKQSKNIERIESIKPCPFCGSRDITTNGYDFGRTFTDNIIDADTEAIVFECKCGGGMEVNVSGIVDVDGKWDHAIKKWNTRAKQ